MSGNLTIGLVAISLAVAMGLSCRPVPRPQIQTGSVYRVLPGDSRRGAVPYRKYCSCCHGIEGDGKGEAAAALEVEPRDFTRGVYRYRSTPSGSLPQDKDLIRSVEYGFPQTAMPAFGGHLTRQEIVDVVATLKGFSPRFGDEEIDESITIPKPVAYSQESVAQGKVHYKKMQCGKCHGETGEGDGWGKDEEMKDDLGRVLHARDFTPGIYRAGNTKEDVYRIFYTGLDGTPMPGYEESLEPDQVYHLVNYMLFLERNRGAWHWLTNPPTWFEPSEQRIEP